MYSDVGQCSFQKQTLSSAAAGNISLIVERGVNNFTLDPLLTRYEQELLTCAYYRLLSRGAQVTSHLYPDVTHILLLPPANCTAFATRFSRIQVINCFIPAVCE